MATNENARRKWNLAPLGVALPSLDSTELNMVSSVTRALCDMYQRCGMNCVIAQHSMTTGIQLF